MRGLAGLLLLMVASCKQAPAAPNAMGKVFTFPVPDGYEDLTETLHQRGLAPTSVAVVASREIKGYRPSITVAKTPIHARVTDLPTCTQTGHSVTGPDGKLKNAAIIDGPVGRACQIHLVMPEGVALTTFLYARRATWFMTCNHADGDAVSERICRQTLAAFKFTK